MTTYDCGDLCLTCNRPASGSAGGGAPFVNRIPADRDAENVHPAIAAAHPGVDLFEGWYCLDCQADDCEACQAEANGGRVPETGRPFDATHYIGATGALCDAHTATVFCTVCDEEIDVPGTPIVLEENGWAMRHAVCP